MGKGLEQYKGKTLHFNAKVGRYGADKNRSATICLLDVSIEEEIVTDHCWLLMDTNMSGLRNDTSVSFNAKVSRYLKPAHNFMDPATIDYRLTKITDFTVN